MSQKQYKEKNQSKTKDRKQEGQYLRVGESVGREGPKGTENQITLIQAHVGKGGNTTNLLFCTNIVSKYFLDEKEGCEDGSEGKGACCQA